MVKCIDDHKDVFGVEPICRLLPIAPSTYYRGKTHERDPELRSSRAKRDEWIKSQIQRVYDENRSVYGADKIWKQLNRESIKVARCTVERLMKELGLKGICRGKRCKTTIRNDQIDKPGDLVNRDFSATRPNVLWVADITFVATWSGFV